MNNKENKLLNEYQLAIIDCLKDYDFINIKFNYYKNNNYYIDCYSDNQKLFTCNLNNSKLLDLFKLQSDIDDLLSVYN